MRRMLPSRWCTAVLLPLLLTTLVTATTATIALSTTPSYRRQLQDPTDAAYALYSLPPFTVTFTSSYSMSGLPDDPKERGQLLAASLHSPLQLITVEFLMETFRIEIAKTNSVSDNEVLESMLDSFMTLDLQVAVRASDHLSLSSSASGGNNNNLRRRRHRQLQQGETAIDSGGAIGSEEATESETSDNWGAMDSEVAIGGEGNDSETAIGSEASNSEGATEASGSEGATDNEAMNSEGATDSERAIGSETVDSEGATNSETAIGSEESDKEGATGSEANYSEGATDTEANNSEGATDSEEFDNEGTMEGETIDNEEPDEYTFPSTATTIGANRAVELLQMEADFFTTAAFLEPTEDTTKPSNKQVADLLGGWMASAFVVDKDIYKDRLVNSEVGVLQHLEQLHIETDSGAVFDPYATGTVPIQQTSTVGSNNEDEMDTPTTSTEESSTHESPIGAWSPSEKLFFLLLVGISILAIAGLLWALKKYRGRGKELDRIFMLGSSRNGTTGPGGVNEFAESIGGRHSDEVMDILNASDRYLAEHRPDLLEAMQNSPTHRDSCGLVIPVANNSETNRPVERRYVTASNPFSYLYGASFLHSEKHAVEQDRRRTPENDPMDGVELQPESVPDDEDLDVTRDGTTDHSVSGFLQTWFHHLAGSRAAEPDDLIMEEEYQEEYQEDGSSEMMACDEDPAQYNFPYQDFPRQDGTPCLIYEETLDEEEEEQYLRSSRRDSLHSTNMYGIHDPLTDDEFQRALSSHNSLDYPTAQSSSFDGASSSDSVVHQPVEDTATEATSPEVESPTHFTEKLERLVAMRHRHYEKQQIVEKHREQRRQERAKQRALQKQQQQEEMKKRDRLLRRHSLELDIQELEAAVGTGSGHGGGNVPSSTSSKLVTPPAHQQQASWGHQPQIELRKLQKPNLHRRTSSEADMGLASTAVAVAGLQTNRSMDVNETSVFDPSATMSTKNDTLIPKRLIQSARKPSKTTFEDVFRPIDARISPTSMSSASQSSSSASSSRVPPTSVSTKIDMVALVSPSSTMTDTASTPTSAGSHHSTPPMGWGGGSVRDGSSARKSKRVTSSASAALAKGFQHRRSMSFGNLEEKKLDDEALQRRQQQSAHQPQAPQQGRHRRTHSINRHRRSNSSSPADVMVHGVYAQFV